MECQYPKCNKEARFSLGINDPDSEPNYYCEDHVESAKMNTIMEIFKVGKKSNSKNG